MHVLKDMIELIVAILTWSSPKLYSMVISVASLQVRAVIMLGVVVVGCYLWLLLLKTIVGR